MKDDYLRDWLVLGPFPSNDLEVDFLNDVGGEQNLNPKVGQQVKAQDGQILTWKSYRSREVIVNLLEAIGKFKNVTAYAYCELDNEELKRYGYIGSDDGVAVWVNGQLVHKNNVARWCAIDQDLFEIDTKKDSNRCLVKITQGVLDWGFALRFSDDHRKGHNDAVRSAVYSPDGERIVTASLDKIAKVWDAKTGTELLTLTGHDGGVWSAIYNPDGERIVTAGGDKTAKVWDAKTGTELLTLTGHKGTVWSASYSPDGERIVTACIDDQTAKVWDAQTGTELLTLTGPDNYVVSSAYSPDGERIVTASYDKIAKVWDAKTGTELLTLTGHDNYVVSSAYSPDGQRIVTASDDKTAKVWDGAAQIYATDMDELLEIAKSKSYPSPSKDRHHQTTTFYFPLTFLLISKTCDFNT